MRPGRARWAEETRRREEIVRAARVFERCFAARRAAVHAHLDARRGGAEDRAGRAHWQERAAASDAAFRLLSRQIRPDEAIRVDGVVYAQPRRGPLMRLALAEIEDWGSRVAGGPADPK
jgi:hypothetical protein